MTGRSQEELVAMLRSTRQGESVSVVVARQEDIFLPRELVRECEHTHTKNLQHPCPHTALLNLHTVSHLSSSLVCQSFPPLLFIICVFFAWRSSCIFCLLFFIPLSCFFIHFLHIVWVFPFSLPEERTSLHWCPCAYKHHTHETHPGHAPAFLSRSGLLTQRCYRKSHTSHSGPAGSMRSCPRMSKPPWVLSDRLPAAADGGRRSAVGGCEADTVWLCLTGDVFSINTHS